MEKHAGIPGVLDREAAEQSEDCLVVLLDVLLEELQWVDDWVLGGSGFEELGEVGD